MTKAPSTRKPAARKTSCDVRESPRLLKERQEKGEQNWRLIKAIILRELAKCKVVKV